MGPLVFKTSGAALGVARWVRLPCAPATILSVMQRDALRDQNAVQRDGHARGRVLGDVMLRTALIGVLLVVVACAPAAPAESPPVDPGVSQIALAGRIASMTWSSTTARFVLDDGREIEVDSAVTRQVHDGAGDAPLLVIARDDRGPWFGVIGTQAGVPDDCLVLNERGTDWGAHIEIAGVAWTKAAEFRSTVDVVPLGTRYPAGMRFCLNDHARVVLAFG